LLFKTPPSNKPEKKKPILKMIMFTTLASAGQ